VSGTDKPSSNTGIVNLYSTSSLSALPKRNASKERPDAGVAALDLRPEPIKSLEHLTNPITSLAFHPEGEIIAAAASRPKDQIKLVSSGSSSQLSSHVLACPELRTQG
jgi:U3 small nucleolar RNA-associated protein 18